MNSRDESENPLRRLEDWEDFVEVRYPAPGQKPREDYRKSVVPVRRTGERNSITQEKGDEMSYRIVPATFWVSALVIVISLLLPGSMSGSGPIHRLSDFEGSWDGFYLASDGGTGPVTSDITEQKSRRLAGEGVLFDLADGDVAYQFRATLSRPDLLNGTGETSKGRLTFKGDLATFAGLGGDAGVMASEYRFIPSHGGASRISSLLLHPFPGLNSPDISGTAEGRFVSLPDPITGDLPDPSFMGTGRMQISPRNNRNSFAGNVQLFLDPDEPATISWPFLATTSDDRRVIWISQGRGGRIIYDGVVIPAPDAESNTFMGGFFTLLLNDGRSFYNAYNFSIRR